MSVKQIRLSTHAKEQLIRLKTRTGISQWNILCRWAFLSVVERADASHADRDSGRQQRRDDMDGPRGRMARTVSGPAQRALRARRPGNIGRDSEPAIAAALAPGHRLSGDAEQDSLGGRSGFARQRVELKRCVYGKSDLSPVRRLSAAERGKSKFTRAAQSRVIDHCRIRHVFALDNSQETIYNK